MGFYDDLKKDDVISYEKRYNELKEVLIDKIVRLILSECHDAKKLGKNKIYGQLFIQHTNNLLEYYGQVGLYSTFPNEKPLPIHNKPGTWGKYKTSENFLEIKFFSETQKEEYLKSNYDIMPAAIQRDIIKCVQATLSKEGFPSNCIYEKAFDVIVPQKYSKLTQEFTSYINLGQKHIIVIDISW